MNLSSLLEILKMLFANYYDGGQPVAEKSSEKWIKWNKSNQIMHWSYIFNDVTENKGGQKTIKTMKKNKIISSSLQCAASSNDRIWKKNFKKFHKQYQIQID